jgi:aminoglycoside 3-N-acetyltransferase I
MRHRQPIAGSDLTDEARQVNSPHAMRKLSTKRLQLGDRAVAAKLFALMTEVFDEQAPAPLSEAYLDQLLTRPDFWALAAFVDDELVGGITAHVLPMTRNESSELFIYDLAVKASHQRQGIGRELVAALRTGGAAAGVGDVFVPAPRSGRGENRKTKAVCSFSGLMNLPTTAGRERLVVPLRSALTIC